MRLDKKEFEFCFLLAGVIFFILSLSFLFAADPDGTGIIGVVSNETVSANSAGQVNISGGYIATINFSAVIQNPRWKAFVGDAIGKFTLDDASGSTIYDWSLSSITGRIYATREPSTPSWGDIDCSDTSNLENENLAMGLTLSSDNLTATFDDATHSTFFVGSTPFIANSCPTLNTYTENVSDDAHWEEMALYDGANIIYATIIEEDVTGFDSGTYDFQMIVPENGTASFTGLTPYYLYVEIGS